MTCGRISEGARGCPHKELAAAIIAEAFAVPGFSLTEPRGQELVSAAKCLVCSWVTPVRRIRGLKESQQHLAPFLT